MKGFVTLIMALLGLGTVLAPRVADAANCTVINSGDTGAGSLRDCIDNVATTDGDVVAIDPSVTSPIALTSGPINIDTAGISIAGAGSAISIIDASGNGGNRIFAIFTISDKTINISGVTLQGATSPAGGAALFLANNILNLSDCVFKDNTATSGSFNGGAIDTDTEATLNISNCEFSNNEVQAGSDGGAISSTGSLFISNSTFSNNRTQTGLGGDAGAIYISGGNALIHNSTFTGNTADASGGAIYNTSGNDLTVRNSTFDGNSSANQRGGAVYNSSGSLFLSNSDFLNNDAFLAGAGAVQLDDFGVIENCFFDNNTAADDDGGAIHNDADMILRNSTFTNNSVSEGNGGAIFVDTTALIENCTVTGNSTSGAGSDDDGGGISASSGPIFINNTTIFDNQSGNHGGGLYVGDTTFINNLTIAGNSAAGDGGGVFVDSTLTFNNTIIAGNTDDGGEPDCFNNSTMISAGANLIQDPTGCVLSSGTAIGGDPMLADALANNGGPGIGVDGAHPTLTLALEVGSAALEAGNNLSCEPTDERGTDRPQGAVCDLGAFEAGPSADLSATSILFGQQEVGTTSATQTIILTNNGTIPLTINSITIGGNNAGDFDQTNNCTSPIAPGASCNIDVTFTPDGTGVRTANITVDTSANVQVIQLLGAGITPDDVDGGGCSFSGMGVNPNLATLWLPLLGLGAMWLIRKRN